MKISHKHERGCCISDPNAYIPEKEVLTTVEVVKAQRQKALESEDEGGEVVEKPHAEVILHIYHVGHSGAINGINEVVQGYLGQGGVFHGAVEVYDYEWSYGYTPEGTGIFQCEPRGCEQHTYKESIYMGDCGKSWDEVKEILIEMIDHVDTGHAVDEREDWQGTSYKLLRHNCCSFCDDLCQKLGVGNIPKWITELAHTGADLEDDEQLILDLVHNASAGTFTAIEDLEKEMGIMEDETAVVHSDAPKINRMHSTVADTGGDFDSGSDDEDLKRTTTMTPT